MFLSVGREVYFVRRKVGGLFTNTIFLTNILSFFSPYMFPLLPICLKGLTRSPKAESFSFFKLGMCMSPLMGAIFFVAKLSAMFFDLKFKANFFDRVFCRPCAPCIVNNVIVLLKLRRVRLVGVGFLRQRGGVRLSKGHRNNVLNTFLLKLAFDFN